MNFVKKHWLKSRWVENQPMNQSELLRQNSQIKQGLVMGMRLAVIDDQAAAVIAEGQLITVFMPGAYQLEEDKIPELKPAKDCDWLYPAQLYYLNLAPFNDCPFSNTAPLLLRDPDLGLQQLSLKGNFEMQIINPTIFMRDMVLAQDFWQLTKLTDYLTQLLSEAIITATIARPHPLSKLDQLKAELEHDIFGQINNQFRPLGLQINRLDIIEFAPLKQNKPAQINFDEEILDRNDDSI